MSKSTTKFASKDHFFRAKDIALLLYIFIAYLFDYAE